MWNKKVSCLLAVLALCGTMAAGAADYTVLEKADKVETTIYGTTQTGSLNDRIASVDKLLNGKSTVSGSLQDKANSLYKMYMATPGQTCPCSRLSTSCSGSIPARLRQNRF